MMLSYRDALATVLGEATTLPAEPVALAQALGRITAEPLRSPQDLPPFDNSAMDGFALAVGAGGALPAGSEHPVSGRQAAGDGVHVAGGMAREIMTGAQMPLGLDSVVAVERCEILSRQGDQVERIRLLDPLARGQNVRLAGSDVAVGDTVLAPGTPVDAAAIMLLAALGVGRLNVRRRPRVAVISTGKELVQDPEEALGPGQIYGSNAPYLAAALQAAGAELVLNRTVGDLPQAFSQALHAALDAGADLVLSTGAVSMGYYDFVPSTLRALGAREVFHKVAIRPGKPLLFGRFPTGTLLFGLPGNPMAVAVGLRFFVAPLLRALAGLPAERPLRASLIDASHARPGLRHFLKARVGQRADGRLQARLLPGQEAFRIRPLQQANAWAVLDEQGAPAPGSLLEVWPLQPGQPLSIDPPGEV